MQMNENNNTFNQDNNINAVDFADRDELLAESTALMPTQDDDDDAVSLPLSALKEKNHYQYKSELLENYTPPPAPELEYREIPKDDKFNVRALVEAAMMIAISLVLAVVSTFVPVAAILAQLLFPLPIALLIVRRGMKVGVSGSVALAGLAILTLGLAQGMYLMIEYGLLGLFFGYCFRYERSPMFTLSVASVIATTCTAIALALTVYVSGLPLAESINMVDDFLNDAATMYQEQLGNTEQQSVNGMPIEEFMVNAVTAAKKIIPAAFIITSMAVALFSYLLLVMMLRRLRYDIKRLPKFSSWRIDWRFTWGLIVGLFCGWAGHQFEISWLATLGDNISLVFGTVIFVCGIGFMAWFLKYTKINMVFKIIIIVLLIQMYSISGYIIILLAVLDSLRDVRGWINRWIDKSDRLRQERNDRRGGK